LGFNLILTTYDAAKHAEVRDVAASPDAATIARARLDQLVPRSSRDHEAIERLEAADRQTWLQALFAEIAAGREEGFFGRSMHLADYGQAVQDPEIAAILAGAEYDDQLCVPDESDMVFLLRPEDVERVAARARALWPELKALSPRAAEEIVISGGTAIRPRIDRRDFANGALPALMGLFVWSAAAGLGIVAANDGLLRLRLPDDEILENTSDLTEIALPPVPPVAQAGRTSPNSTTGPRFERGKNLHPGIVFSIIVLALALAFLCIWVVAR
jgi:hypothetical protein